MKTRILVIGPSAHDSKGEWQLLLKKYKKIGS